jgi:hypothetical protein
MIRGRGGIWVRRVCAIFIKRRKRYPTPYRNNEKFLNTFRLLLMSQANKKGKRPVLKIKVIIIFLQYNDIAFRRQSAYPAKYGQEKQIICEEGGRFGDRAERGTGDRKRDEQWNVAFLRWGENNSCENSWGILWRSQAKRNFRV